MNAQVKFKHLEEKYQVKISDQIRDTRTPWQKLYAFLLLPRVSGLSYAGAALSLIFAPAAWLVACILVFAIWFTLLGHVSKLPFNIPFVSEVEDPNDPAPGGYGFNKAMGVLFLGNKVDTNEELYLNFDSALRHMAVFGTTGSGKTETLASMVAAYLSTGAGAVFNDAKASPKLAWQIYSICRYFGRDDDFLIINYLKGNASSNLDPATRLSNDCAIFAFGNAEAVAQIIISFLPADSGSNKVFSEAAVALVSAIMPALVELRDQGLISIDPATIRKYMEYHYCTQLMNDENISYKARQAILAFIASRSGYKKSKAPDKQDAEVTKQFGFAQAYFIRSLSSLSDTYGHIYMTGAGEVDFQDVILNDRVMVNMLPAMEKAGDELSNLGKIILSSLRNAMSIGLGYEVEGEREDILESLPTATNRPSLIISDEYGYMAVKGFAITAAQGRGLNFALVFAGQDYAGFKRDCEKEAQQIIANCLFKYIMALEDVNDTLKLVQDLAGEVRVSLARGHQLSPGAFNGYVDTLEANYEKIQAISVKDLKGLGQGEGFGFFKDKIVYMKNFWHGLTDKDISDYYHIPRRVNVDFRPKRGELVDALSIESRKARQKLDIWLDHIDEGVDYSPSECPKRLASAITKFKDTGAEKSLSASKQGMYAFSLLNEEAVSTPKPKTKAKAKAKAPADAKSDPDTPDPLSTDELTSQGIFNILSGDFGQDAGTEINGEDSDQEQETETETEKKSKATDEAIERVTKMFAELHLTDDKPAATPLTESTDHDEPNNIVPENDGEALIGDLTDELDGEDDAMMEPEEGDMFFRSTEESAIATGIASIERSLGSSEAQARQAGKDIADRAQKATEYPTDPKPSKADADQDKMKSLIQQYLKG